MTVVLGIEDPNEIEDFLAHYGVKGMKWGIRKETDSSPRIVGNKEFVARQTGKTMVAVGVIGASRALGAAGGTAVAGLGVGTAIGGMAGSVAGTQIISRTMGRSADKKKSAAKENLSGLIPQRSDKYADKAVKRDINTWGPDSAQRINRSMLQGKSLSEARKAEQRLQRQAAIVSVGAAFAQITISRAVSRVATHPEVRKAAKAQMFDFASKKGAARAARKNPSMKIGPALQFVKPSRKGVYNVTSMK